MVKARIFMADNDKDLLESYSDALREEGYEVTPANTFLRAEETLETRSEEFDVAILDIRLKDENNPNDRSGIQLARRFGGDSLPVIILTKLEGKEEIKLALETDGHRPPAVAYVEKSEGAEALLDAVRKAFRPKVFVAHGHDKGAKDAVVFFLRDGYLRPVVLQAEAGAGQTTIEKFEKHSNVQYAVVLVTPDDVGANKTAKSKLRPRARQNVIFELGYFLGKLGRQRVSVLYKNANRTKIEIPSNYKGVQFVLMDEGEAWKGKLNREMKKVLPGIQSE